LNYVINAGGYALLMGVNIYKLTAMHYVEDLLPQDISDIFNPSKEVQKIYPSDQWFIETGEPPVKPWYIIIILLSLMAMGNSSIAIEVLKQYV